MNVGYRTVCLCVLLVSCLFLSAQTNNGNRKTHRKVVRIMDLPPFERAVQAIKFFEGWHGRDKHPYIGYGHRVLPHERLTSDITERQADSLLRADLMQRFEVFKRYGKDALLLAVLSYNVGVGSILGYGDKPQSRLLRKIERGDRDFYREYLSFCHYKGKMLRGLVRRRQVEFALFFIP